MGDDDAGDACRERGVDDDRDLGAAEMAGRERQLVPRDDVEHLRERAAVQANRFRRDSSRRELGLDPPPHRLLRGARTVLGCFVLGVDCGEPDDAGA